MTDNQKLKSLALITLKNVETINLITTIYIQLLERVNAVMPDENSIKFLSIIEQMEANSALFPDLIEAVKKDFGL